MSPKLLPELRDQFGYVVIMYPNDHLPAHVHVYSGEKVARVEITETFLAVMDSNGFRQRELKQICDILEPYRAYLIERWDEMHPDLPFVASSMETDDE